MKDKRAQKVEIILKDSYIQAIKNSLGSNLFRNLYARVNGRRKDILEDGRLSCAIFVSSVLRNFSLISEIHATVNGAEKDLQRSGWIKLTKPKPGAILVWEAKKYSDGYHKHIGFFIGADKAVSNNTRKHRPVIHHWTFGQKNDPTGQPIRTVESIYWHPNLN